MCRAKSDAPRSRRHALGAIVGVPLVVALPTTATAPRSDRELIDLVEASIAASTKLRTAPALEGWNDARLDTECDRWRDLHRRAVALPATTHEGRAAKARLVLDDRRGDQDGFAPEHDALASLLRDLAMAVGA